MFCYAHARGAEPRCCYEPSLVARKPVVRNRLLARLRRRIGAKCQKTPPCTNATAGRPEMSENASVHDGRRSRPGLFPVRSCTEVISRRFFRAWSPFRTFPDASCRKQPPCTTNCARNRVRARWNGNGGAANGDRSHEKAFMHGTSVRKCLRARGFCRKGLRARWSGNRGALKRRLRTNSTW